MLSDTLSQAATDIRRDLDAYGHMYEEIRPQIDEMLMQIEAIRAFLDHPPGASFEGVERKVRALTAIGEPGGHA